MTFPKNPVDGQIIEVDHGTYFIYRSAQKSWTELTATKSSLGQATPLQSGLMTAEDLKKLNRLILPPITSSLTADNCSNVYGYGNFGLKSLDNIVKLDSSRTITTSDDSVSLPYQIHENTFGFNFNLDLEQLVQELQLRGQFTFKGRTGAKGPTGPKGPTGSSQQLTGPAGDTGPQGLAPPCTIQIEREIFPVKPSNTSKKVITGIRMEQDPNDLTKFKAIAQRQDAGFSNLSSGVLSLSSDYSSWVLALTSTSTASQQVYYLDVEPLVTQIHEKYLEEVQKLKSGFESVVTFWLQTMSDLFDEQKLALCCALEFCQSRKANTSSRQHIESVMANTIGKAAITINDRNSSDAISFPVAPDCNHTGFPTPGSSSSSSGSSQVCANCLLSQSSPSTLTITDKLGTIILSKTQDSNSYVGCRLVDMHNAVNNCVTTGDFIVNQMVTVVYQVSCTASGSIFLKVIYPTCKLSNGNIMPTLADGDVSCGDAVNGLPNWASSSDAHTSYYELPFGSCTSQLSYNFNVSIQDVYGAGSTTVQVSGSISGGVTTNCTIPTNLVISLLDPIGTVQLQLSQDKLSYYGCRMSQFSLSNGTTVLVPVNYKLYCDASTNFYKLDISYPVNGSSSQGDPDTGYACDSVVGSKITGTLSSKASSLIDSVFVTGTSGAINTICSNIYGVASGVRISVLNNIMLGGLSSSSLDISSCLFSKTSLSIVDPFFGKVPLQKGYSVALGGIQTWSGCIMVNAYGSTSHIDCGNLTQISVPIRYDIYVDNGKYALQIKYPACSSVIADGIPTSEPDAVSGTVVCSHLDGGIGNVWKSVSYQSFISCDSFNLNFNVSLPKIYSGNDNNIAVQSIKGFLVTDSDSDSLLVPARINQFEVDVDASSTCLLDSVKLDLPAGDWTVSIVECCPNVGGKYGASVRLQHSGSQVVRFLNKGMFSSKDIAAKAYDGLSVRFYHSGGSVKLWIASGINGGDGSVRLKFSGSTKSDKQIDLVCSVGVDRLAWYQRGWQAGIGCGAVVSVPGQDFIVVRRSIGSDKSCGGGNERGVCYDMYGEYAIAWPTFDGKSFAGLPESGSVKFEPNGDMTLKFAEAMASGNFKDVIGNFNALSTILFPVVQ